MYFEEKKGKPKSLTICELKPGEGQHSPGESSIVLDTRALLTTVTLYMAKKERIK